MAPDVRRRAAGWSGSPEDRHVADREHVDQPGQVDHVGSRRRQPFGVPLGAVAHGDRGSEEGGALRHLGRHLPGAHHEHPAVGEVTAVLGRRERDSRGRHRTPARAEACAAVHPTRGVDGRREQPFEVQTADSRGPAGVRGGPDLSHDVSLAEHERLQAGCDPEQVPGCLSAGEEGRSLLHDRRRQVPVRGHRMHQGRRLRGTLPAGVDLGAFAGGEHAQLGGTGARAKVLECLRQLGPWKRQCLQDRHRNATARHRQAGQGGHRMALLARRARTVATVVRWDPMGAACR
jgi:hypothetical protein